MGRRSFQDSRNQLVFDFAKLVAEMRPRYFVLENVPGMVSLPVKEADGGDLVLDLLLERFHRLGYDVAEPRVLNACEWDVPQDRRRLILLGTRRPERPLGYPQPQSRPLSTTGDPATLGDPEFFPAGTCPTVWDAIGDLPDLDDYSSSRFSDEIAIEPKEVEAMEAKASSYVRALRGLEDDPSDRSHRRSWDRAVVTSSCRTSTPLTS